MTLREKFSKNLTDSQKKDLTKLLDSYYYKGYSEGYSEGKFEERCCNFYDYQKMISKRDVLIARDSKGKIREINIWLE